MFNLRLASTLLPLWLVLAGGAQAQNPTCPTRPVGDNSNACASTAFIGQGFITTSVNAIVNPYTPPTGFPTTVGAVPFGITETVAGTCSAANGANCHYNFINITSDNAVVGPNSQGNWGTGEGFIVNHNFGGAAAIGQRGAAIFNLQQTATTGNTAAGASYSSVAAYANAAANDNGTDTTLANSRGQLETVNFIAHLGPSATNWHVVQGGEVDINLEAGSSVYEKVGWQIVQFSTDQVRGSTVDAALVLTNGSGAIGWLNGLQFGGAQGVFPIAATGAAISCVSPCGTMANIIDFSSVGFSVNGSGTITTGLNGTAGGQLRLRGSTSGGSTLSTDSAGNLILANGTANQQVIFNDAGDGTMFSVTGAAGAIAARVNVTAATTGVAPQISASGTDTNININLVPKGTGVLQANGTNTLSVTKTVRASGGAADCTLVFNFGMLTGGTC
jgi:hypothetical protein